MPYTGSFSTNGCPGLRTIAQNTGRPGASWEDGVLAMAERPDAEEIVGATVEIDGD